MPDIFLRPGEPNPNDVKLRDTTLADSGAGVTATPDTASLILATFAPTVTASDHQTATPGVAALVLTGLAPTVTASNHQTVTPPVASLVLATFAPTVTASDHKTVTPSTATLTLATFAPVVTASNHITATPSTASLVLATFAPTVSTSAPVTVTPGVAALVLTGYAPEVAIIPCDGFTGQLGTEGSMPGAMAPGMDAPCEEPPVVGTLEPAPGLWQPRFAEDNDPVRVSPRPAHLRLVAYPPVIDINDDDIVLGLTEDALLVLV